MIPLHLGAALHPLELALTLLVAVGPFVALAVVVAVRRREDQRPEDNPDRVSRTPGADRRPGPGR